LPVRVRNVRGAISRITGKDAATVARHTAKQIINGVLASAKPIKPH
jgi:hypothetical protein